jgi:hypothetical protein
VPGIPDCYSMGRKEDGCLAISCTLCASFACIYAQVSLHEGVRACWRSVWDLSDVVPRQLLEAWETDWTDARARFAPHSRSGVRLRHLARRSVWTQIRHSTNSLPS